MGVAKKNKRKIIFQEKEFYWNVAEDFEWNDGQLAINIASDDKKFIVRYYAIQKSEKKRLIIIGRNFPGIEGNIGTWKRLICPDFTPNIEGKGITPKHIRTILEWCFDENKHLTEINWKGEITKLYTT